MTEVALPETVLLPHSGELVAVNDLAAVGRAIDELRRVRIELDGVLRDLRRATAAASMQAGTKTLRVEGVELVVKGGRETLYDAEKIEAGLRRAGMAEDRIREIVLETVTYKVSAVELKKAAAANPAYDRVMRRHMTTVEKTPDVEVRLGRPAEEQTA